MQVDDKAARGREAALRVRRRKKKDRQAAVRELEERGAPRMQIRSDLAALGFKVSQSTVQNDLADLGYGQRRPRKPRSRSHDDARCAARSSRQRMLRKTSEASGGSARRSASVGKADWSQRPGGTGSPTRSSSARTRMGI